MTTHLSVKDARNLVSMLGGVLILGLILSTPASAIVEGTDCEVEPTDQEIRYGDLIRCSIDVIGDEDEFRFDGGSGETIRIQTSRLDRTGQACFQPYAPDSTPLRAVPTCGAQDFLLDQTGIHTIVATDLNNNQTVQYALALERIVPPSPAAFPIDYGERKSDDIAGIGDADIWFFSGEAGDTVRIATSRLDGTGQACFQPYAPDGTPLRAVPTCGAQDFLLDQTGTHTIVATDLNNNQTVAYALTLGCVAGVCPPGPSVPDVSGCLALRGAPVIDTPVRLTQPEEDVQEVRTDVRGCYEFGTVVTGKTFEVGISGPEVPE